MGMLYLVRHGQASFGADDYDSLSPLGERQCRALGDWMRARGIVFDTVMRGTLRRHGQSLEALSQVLPGLPATREWPGLNEYDAEAVVRAVHPGPLPPVTDAAAFRLRFRLLREGLLKWSADEVRPAGMPAWSAFVAGVVQALDQVRAGPDGNVLIMSSGGPISVAVAQVLGAPAAVAIELNMSLRNSAVTAFGFNAKRHLLQEFNALPHLDHPDRAGWVSYA